MPNMMLGVRQRDAVERQITADGMDQKAFGAFTWNDDRSRIATLQCPRFVVEPEVCLLVFRAMTGIAFVREKRFDVPGELNLCDARRRQLADVDRGVRAKGQRDARDHHRAE